MKLEVKVWGEYHPVALLCQGGRSMVRMDGKDREASLRSVGGGRHELTLDGHVDPVWIAATGETVHVHAFGRAWELELIDPVDRAAGEGQGGDHVIRAPMPGIVVEIQVAAGAQVGKGDPLMTIESMKLETVIAAWRDGVVEEVHRAPGDAFDRGAPLVTLGQEE